MNSVLQNISRITRNDYVPSAADVLRARLRTEGVQEHRIDFENGPDSGKSWQMIDVGGSKRQVRISIMAWLSLLTVFLYSDVCFISFLIPIHILTIGEDTWAPYFDNGASFRFSLLRLSH